MSHTCALYLIIYSAADPRGSSPHTLYIYIYTHALHVWRARHVDTQLARRVQTMSRAITPWTHFARYVQTMSLPCCRAVAWRVSDGYVCVALACTSRANHAVALLPGCY